MSRILSPSKDYLKKKRKNFIIKLFVFIFVFLLSIVGLVFLSRMEKININKISILGSDIINKEDISKKTADFLNGKYLYIFPKTNIFLYPKTDLINYLYKEYPRIKNIEIKDISLDFKTLEISISLRESKALWCDKLSLEEGEVSRCYFLDDLGFVFAPSPDFSGNAYFKYYGILPYGDPIGSYFLEDKEKFKEISSLVDEIYKLEISPLYMVAENQEKFTIYLAGGSKIFFDTTESILKTKERIHTLIKSDDLFKKEGGILEVDYIDLRFGDKVFYKLKTEN